MLINHILQVNCGRVGAAQRLDSRVSRHDLSHTTRTNERATTPDADTGYGYLSVGLASRRTVNCVRVRNFAMWIMT